MANILIISAVFPPEPVVSATLSRDIAEELSKKNKVTVLCPKPTRPVGFLFEKGLEPKNYEVIRLNSYTHAASDIIGRFRESYSFGRHCVRYMLENSTKINCVYLNSWPLFSQYLIIKTGKKIRVPCVIHIQDIYPESLTNKLPKPVKGLFNFFFLPFDKFILRHATKIIGISQNMISYLSVSRKVNKNKFELIRNWQDDSGFLNYIPANIIKKGFVFMYLGSISPSAGVEVLINSFHKADLPGTTLKIVGNGSDKKNCEAIADRLGNSNIEFYDVSPENVPAMQAGSDVLLLPLKKGISRTATPSKLTAYLLSGKPVMACVEEESDVAKILKDADCGFITEPENVESIALGMKKIFNLNRNELERLGKNGKEYAILNLSKKTNLEKLVSVIENTIQWK